MSTEARVFARYLVGREASPQAVKVYEAAMQGNVAPNATDQKLLHFMLAHPWSIGFIDAGLVFHNATSEARRRLYIMLAILEASPEHTDLFLPVQRSPWYIFTVVWTGIRAVFKAIVGLVLVKVVE